MEPLEVLIGLVVILLLLIFWVLLTSNSVMKAYKNALPAVSCTTPDNKDADPNCNILGVCKCDPPNCYANQKTDANPVCTNGKWGPATQ